MQSPHWQIYVWTGSTLVNHLLTLLPLEVKFCSCLYSEPIWVWIMIIIEIPPYLKCLILGLCQTKTFILCRLHYQYISCKISTCILSELLYNIELSDISCLLILQCQVVNEIHWGILLGSINCLWSKDS